MTCCRKHCTQRAGAALTAVLFLALSGLLANTAQAAKVGYYDMCYGEGPAWAVTPITNAGHTPIHLTDLTAADLNGVNVLFVTNCYSSYEAEFLSRMGDITNAVVNGLVLMIHDRYVSGASQILPGGAGIQTVRNFSSDIDVADPTTLVTNGPAGQLNNTSLDKMRYSDHGFTYADSLPADNRVILSRPDPSLAVTFSYKYGLGSVIYSSMTIDFIYSFEPVCERYANYPDPDVQAACINIATVYTPNVIAYAADLANSVPLANAGPDQSVNEGDTVSLDGTASHNPGGGDVTYQWTQLAPVSPLVDLQNDLSAYPVFIAPYSNDNITYTFQLVVTNAGGTPSDPDTVDITVKNINNPPVADAGDDFAIKAGASTTLDGSNSYDPDNDTTLFYSWTQLSGPAVVLENANTAKPGFVVPNNIGEALVLELSMSDGKESSIPSTVTVTIVDNAAPIADAGPDITKDEGGFVVLSALASHDPDGDSLLFDWKQVSGPVITLDDTSLPTPSFTAPKVSMGGEAAGFEVTVTDTGPLNPKSSSDLVIVNLRNINDPPACHLAQPSLASLWPPNHKMRPISITGVSDTDTTYKDVAIVVTGITQDEPLVGYGSGHSSPDGIIQDKTPEDTVLLRAERMRRGNGRVYQVNFSAGDGFESCTGFINVSVPPSRKHRKVIECDDRDDEDGHKADKHGHKHKKNCVVKRERPVAIDDGQLYDSTEEVARRRHNRHDHKDKSKEKHNKRKQHH